MKKWKALTIACLTVVSISILGIIAYGSFKLTQLLTTSQNTTKNDKLVAFDPKNLQLREYKDFNDPIVSPHKIIPLQKYEMQVVASDLNSTFERINNKVEEFQNVAESVDEYGRHKLEFIDPYTNVIFREYSYIKDSNGINRYMLGKNALVKLAQEFKRKVPFGPEVFDLEAININDFYVIPSEASGLYSPANRNIYVNGQRLLERGVSLYGILSQIMPTIFHEYMHHWSNSYAEIGTKSGLVSEKDSQKSLKTLYAGLAEEKEFSSEQLWNYDFATKFKQLLHFNTQRKTLTSSDDELFNKKILSNWLSLNSVWKLANTDEKVTGSLLRSNKWDTRYLNNEDNLKDWYFSYIKDANWVVNGQRLQYLYSLTELIPREYTKYAYENYLQLGSPLYTLQDGDFLLNWYGSIQRDQRYNTKMHLFSQSDDWAKVYQLNLQEIIQNQNLFQKNNLVMPNNIFGGQIHFNDQNGQQTQLLKNNARSFYQLFLNNMGYGKAIAQIYPKVTWKWNDQISDDNKLHNEIKTEDADLNKIKFSGYLPSKKYTGFVLIDKENHKTTTKFKYMDTFNFFGKQTYDTGAFLLDEDQREIQAQTRIYPQTNLTPYISEDFVEISQDSKIYFWKDLNQNGIAEDNEIDTKVFPSVYSDRLVTNLRSRDGINTSRLSRLYVNLHYDSQGNQTAPTIEFQNK